MECKQNLTMSVIPLCLAHLSEADADVISVGGCAVVLMAANDFVFIFNSTLHNFIQVSFLGIL